jgi:hypothetical protein
MEEKITLCDPCCEQCPTIFKTMDGIIHLQDDFGGHVQLTERQFKILFEFKDAGKLSTILP